MPARKPIGKSILNRLDEYEWREITFEGETFPATSMGISIVEPAMDLPETDLGSWLWSLSICKGSTKSSSRDECMQHSGDALNIFLERRSELLAAISERPSPFGFSPEETDRDWVLSMQRIHELSKGTIDTCSWSAPSHHRDDPNYGKTLLKFLISPAIRAMKKHWVNDAVKSYRGRNRIPSSFLPTLVPTDQSTAAPSHRPDFRSPLFPVR